MSNKMLKIAGEAPDQSAQPFKLDEERNVGFGLNRASAKQFHTHRAIGARNAENLDSDLLTTDDLKGYNNFFIEVSNGLDVDVTVRIRRGGSWYYELLTVKANRPGIFTPKEFPCLYLPGATRELMIRITPNQIPSTGSVSCWLHATP